MPAAPTFYEFFAGGGMARAGLGPGWRCVFANDHDPIKAASYRANWGGEHLCVADVASLAPSALPGRADLAWASFPCQDLSLAGAGAGLGEASGRTRSGVFWAFWGLMQSLAREGRAPRAIVLENVPGVLTSRGGRDFAAIGEAFAAAGYRFGALLVDAVAFVPQSRPRVFFAALAPGERLPASLTAEAPPDGARSLLGAWAGLSERARGAWVWWRLPPPPPRPATLAELMEDEPPHAAWHAPAQTARLLGMMSALNRAKVDAALLLPGRTFGCVYRRTRPCGDGLKRQRAEVRFDGVAGCLRTPAGGSSRQTLLVVRPGEVRSRLLTPREAARLMGVGDGYVLPARFNDAYRLAGDGVCPPVVRHLAERLLEPLLAQTRQAAARCGSKRRCTPLPAALEA